MNPELVFKAVTPRSERRCLRCIRTHDELEKISQSVEVDISRRAIAIVIKERKRDK